MKHSMEATIELLTDAGNRMVTITIPAEVGLLKRRVYRQALNWVSSECDTFEVRINYKETKGWLDSLFMLQVEGAANKVLLIVEWLNKLD